MFGFLILILVLVGGFASGYATREMISRQRRAQYLKFKPYVSAANRPKQPPAFLVQPANPADAKR